MAADGALCGLRLSHLLSDSNRVVFWKSVGHPATHSEKYLGLGNGLAILREASWECRFPVVRDCSFRSLNLQLQ